MRIMAGFPIESQNGCNKETKAALKGYLKEIYGPNSGNGPFSVRMMILR